jgi:hypothetical protein
MLLTASLIDAAEERSSICADCQETRQESFSRAIKPCASSTMQQEITACACDITWIIG